VSRRRLILIAVVVAAGIAIVASGVLSDIPDAETIIEDVAEALGKWTYALVAALAFLETGAFVGLIAPGEFTVILGGVIAGQGEINVMLLLALTWLAAFLGDTTSFVIGSRNAARDADAAPNQARAAELNGQVSDRNRKAALAFGIGSAAAAAGALLLLWPVGNEGAPQPEARVSMGGATVWVKGRF